MIEVLKQALEALERSVATCFDQYAHQQVMSQPDHFINQAITSLRQAISELESQEPVAWMRKDATLRFADGKMFAVGQPFYTHPPQRTWQGLTDDEHCDIWYKESLDWMEYGKAIEAKLKQKNGYVAQETNS